MAGQILFPLFQSRSGSRVRGKRVSTLAPRMAPSALRVPHPSQAQIPLIFTANFPQVFVHEGTRQAMERRLEGAVKKPVSLHINDNIHSVITLRERGGQLRVGLHHMFLDAPANIQDALIRYITAVNGGDGRSASLLIGRYIHENHHRIRASRPPLQPLKMQGQIHDLRELMGRVNERYFGGEHDALVTWGRASHSRPSLLGEKPSPRRSIKLGSYSAVERLIRIHPALDKVWVPRYFVEYILYHEMLHHVIPTSRICGRAVIHSPEFCERERNFRSYERALAWEREHLARLLRT